MLPWYVRSASGQRAQRSTCALPKNAGSMAIPNDAGRRSVRAVRGRSVLSGYPSARSKHFIVDAPTMPNADSVALTVGPGALAHTAQE